MSIQRAAKTVFRKIKVVIPSGPNEGLKWSLGTGRHYRDGTFCLERAQVIAALIQEGDCFWDIGAHRGYITLLAARRVGKQGKVYAFEPASDNLWYLKTHIEWNALANVEALPIALSHCEGAAHFGGEQSSLSSRLREEGGPLVETGTVASLVDSGRCLPPTFLKIDAEGAEADILNSAGNYLTNPNLALMVSTHSPELHAECGKILRTHGYRLFDSAKVAQARQSGWNRVEDDPEILALGSGRRVAPETIERFKQT